MPGAQHYVVRETGELREEAIVQSRFFDWLYNTAAGVRCRPLFMHSRALHRLVGWFTDSRLSRPLVPRFVAAARVNVNESALAPAAYGSLNAFFTRRLAAGTHRISDEPGDVVCPGDGKLFVTPRLTPNATLAVKGQAISVPDLLVDPHLARRFRGGTGAVLRLYLPDYHRIHFPVAGTPQAPRHIPGHYYSVSPFSGNDHNFYALNARVVIPLATTSAGLMALVAVGGFLIARVELTHVPARAAERGAELGWFAFGGSTLVILAEADRIQFDDDLVDNSQRGRETYVRMGSRIAHER